MNPAALEAALGEVAKSERGRFFISEIAKGTAQHDAQCDSHVLILPCRAAPAPVPATRLDTVETKESNELPNIFNKKYLKKPVSYGTKPPPTSTGSFA